MIHHEAWARFWLSKSKKLRVINQYGGRNAAATRSSHNAHRPKPGDCPSSESQERAGSTEPTQREVAHRRRTARTNTTRFRGFHLKACPPPQAAGSSGYGGKPAARVARSASLFMTQSGPRPWPFHSTNVSPFSPVRGRTDWRPIDASKTARYQQISRYQQILGTQWA